MALHHLFFNKTYFAAENSITGGCKLIYRIIFEVKCILLTKNICTSSCMSVLTCTQKVDYYLYLIKVYGSSPAPTNIRSSNRFWHRFLPASSPKFPQGPTLFPSRCFHHIREKCVRKVRGWGSVSSESDSDEI